MLSGTLVTLRRLDLARGPRDTRMSPISAVREGGMVVKKPSRWTLVFGLAVTALSAAVIGNGTLGDDVSTAARVLASRSASLSLHRRRAALAAARPPARARSWGWPATRFGGAAGRLAQGNAMRNPGRTASTAAALMIGLTLVTFVSVFGKALLESDEKAIEAQLGTSHVITSQSGWDTVPVGAGEAAAAAPGVVVSSSIRGDRAQLDGRRRGRRQRRRPGDDRRAYNFEWVEGSASSLASLRDGGAIVREGLESRRWRGERRRPPASS